MAKIKLLTFWLNDRTTEVRAHLEYKGKDNYKNAMFFVRVPDNMMGFIKSESVKDTIATVRLAGKNWEVISGDDEKEAEANFKTFAEAFYNAGVKTEKVILYQYRNRGVERKGKGVKSIYVKRKPSATRSTTIHRNQVALLFLTTTASAM